MPLQVPAHRPGGRRTTDQGDLTIVDTHSRYCPTVDPRFAYRGEDVVRTLERICRQIGYPQTIRVDNGIKFVSRDLDLWAYANDVTLDFSRPGKPTDSG